jgi:hypothetical protein
MENNPQAQTPTPANSPSAQVPESANGVLSPDLQTYVAEPTPNEPANPVEAQVQGQPAQAPAVSPEVADLQRKLNERQIEIYQAQQRAQQAELQAQQILMQTQGQGVNQEPDPNTNWAGWIQWNNRQTEKRIMEGVAKQQQQFFGNLMQSANEVKFVETHPGVDISQLKSFAQMRGIQNIEDAYVIMNLPQITNGAAIQASQQTMQNFRQPNGATPLRTQPSSAPQGQQMLSYQKMAEAYIANPNVYNKWPKDLQEAFDKETWARKNSA